MRCLPMLPPLSHAAYFQQRFTDSSGNPVNICSIDHAAHTTYIQPSRLLPARLHRHSSGNPVCICSLDHAQGSLLEGLQQHASSGGAKSALQALQQSVGHMQSAYLSAPAKYSKDADRAFDG
eukprot:1156674-Pelagomonas_calceolata.AAC.27